MVKATTVFKTTTGKTLDSEFEAWSEELRDFLVKNGADNDAIARKIVHAIAEGQPETLCMLADIVENMHRCAPVNEPIKTPEELFVDARKRAEDLLANVKRKIVVPYGTAIARCMGGNQCVHTPGTCTATAAVEAPPPFIECEKCHRIVLNGEDCHHCGE